MKQDDFKVCVTYQGKEYPFNYGSEAYIFHTGLYNSFYDTYGPEHLLEYTAFVHNCYINDDHRTPLGALADYIAEHWTSVKNKGKHKVLREFYDYYGEV